MFTELNYKKSNIWKNMPHGLQVIHNERFDTMTESWSKYVVIQREHLEAQLQGLVCLLNYSQ